MKFYKKILILMICCLPFFMTVNAQESTTKQQKKIEKQKEKKDQETLINYQKALKAHNKDQSKATRKKMKQTLRDSNRLASGRKGFFLKRWFSHKKK